MKKTKFITVLSTLFLVTACGHEHSFTGVWSYDENQHWHAATCKHSTEKSGVRDHTFQTETENGRKVTKCITCGYIKTGTSGGGSSDPIDPNGIQIAPAEVLDIDSNLYVTSSHDSTFEIHTADQKTYLEYSGSYKTMPSSSYPDGTKTISDPNKAKLEWDYSDDDNVKSYSVTISQRADFAGGFTIEGSKAKSLDLYNLFLGKNYVRVNATLEDDTKVCSETTEITVDSTYPRNLYIGAKMTNDRDCGGRTTMFGGTIRQGVLYRTCGNGYNMDGQKIDDEGKKIMLNQLGMKTEINLSDNGSYNFNLTGTKLIDAYMDYATSSNPSRHHFSRNTENVKNVFAALAEPANYPVYYHCRIGTDRTGLVAILVNGLLGVDLNEIYQDYLFSNFGKIGKKRYIGDAAGDDNILNYMNEIEAMPGDNFQEKTYNALLTIGVPRTTLDKIIDLLTIGTKPNNNKGQAVVTADNMELSGTTLKTVSKTSGTERSHPAAYATLSKNASATMKVNIEEAGTKTVYGYIGHTNASSSLKVESSITVAVDGSAVTIPSITFANAGMGNCSNRMNYYFVKLGTVEMSAGEHTITVLGVANDMNIGNIAVF